MNLKDIILVDTGAGFIRCCYAELADLRSVYPWVSNQLKCTNLATKETFEYEVPTTLKVPLTNSKAIEKQPAVAQSVAPQIEVSKSPAPQPSEPSPQVPSQDEQNVIANKVSLLEHKLDTMATSVSALANEGRKQKVVEVSADEVVIEEKVSGPALQNLKEELGVKDATDEEFLELVKERDQLSEQFIEVSKEKDKLYVENYKLENQNLELRNQVKKLGGRSTLSVMDDEEEDDSFVIDGRMVENLVLVTVGLTILGGAILCIRKVFKRS